jgi:tetratricopeptide (TPR) repeat protein
MKTILEAENCFESGRHYHNLARELKCRSDLDKAIKCYEQAISFNSNYIEAYRGLSICYGDLGDNQKAMEFAVIANEIEKSN